MEGLGVGVEEKRCGNCRSFNTKTGKCDSVDTRWTNVYEHNWCRYFYDKVTFINKLKNANTQNKIKQTKKN